MPKLCCAFWLTVVYGSILLHPRVPHSSATSGEADAARVISADVKASLAGASGVAALCVERAGTCGEAALAAARGDAGRLAALVAASLAVPRGTTAVMSPSPEVSGADAPVPVPDPRRHARARLLTGTP